VALLSFVAGGSISTNDVVYVDSTGLVHKASATTSPQATAAGVAIDGGSAGSLIRVNPDAFYANFSGFVAGEVQYISLTSGELSTYETWIADLGGSSLPGAFLARVGTAASTSGLDIEFSRPVFVSSSGL
jgi:hypothetical protein